MSYDELVRDQQQAETEVQKSKSQSSLIHRITRGSERKQIIEKTLRNISMELSLDYMFSIHGDQRFEVWSDVVGDENQEMISRLIYPYRGYMAVFNGQVGFWDKFFIGGRYGNSQFQHNICTDEDWNFWALHNGTLKWIDYQVTKQDCMPKVGFFDINLYYRLLDLDREKLEPGPFYSMKGYGMQLVTPLMLA